MKRFNILLVAFALFSISNCAYDWTPVNDLFNNLILKKVIPGAVVMVGNNGSALFQSPYGTLTYQTDAFEQRVQNDTMYDVASLTKVMGTTAAIISLLDGKQIALTDLVTKYLPQYGNGGKGNTTIANLLLHNAGLLYDYPGPLPPVVEEIWTYLWYVKPAYPIGSKWSYSNLGYVLLGEIIKKVTGKSLQDYFHQSQVFMGLKETMFNPPANYTYRIAPCEYDAELRHRIVRGEAHERLSYYLGGETGHSGLFTTATDVTRYVRLILNLGKIGIEARAFSAATV
jgi:CubicO group peptidase (beta-lactamase class C family)